MRKDMIQKPQGDRGRRYEKWVLLGVIFVGAFRVFLYNMAFPAFNNVDEAAHFDLVWCYSEGNWPEKAVQPLQQQTAELCVLFGSPEYLKGPETLPERKYSPPPGTFAAVRSDPMYPYMVQQAGKIRNYEAGSFPTYYIGAGFWAAIGRVCGLQGENLFYWIRFLNVPMFVWLIWLCSRIAVHLFPESIYFRIGLPVAAALFPQDLFFTINSDTFCAVFFALVFYLFLRMYRNPPSFLGSLITGLVAAGTFLVKPSNVAVVVLLVLFGISQGLYYYREKQLKGKGAASLLVLFLSAGIPVGLWMLYCHAVFGDWTGAAEKIHHLGWTVKPLSNRFDHPIFRLSGLEFFFAELTRTFWRGELFWHGKRMASEGMDSFYVFLTFLLLLAALIKSIWPARQAGNPSRKILRSCWILVGISVLFLVWISIRFDYGACHYPSREKPFFTSGRLIFCIFVPFLLLFLHGLRTMCFRWKDTLVPLAVLILIFLFITIQEAVLNAPAFHSAYNWFHLP